MVLTLNLTNFDIIINSVGTFRGYFGHASFSRQKKKEIKWNRNEEIVMYNNGMKTSLTATKSYETLLP